MALLLLEIGLVECRKGVATAALVLPAILLVLTAVGHRSEPTYQWFLAQFVERLGGTPLYLTLLASLGFYAYAALRRAPMAFDAISAALLALAFVAPQSLDLTGLVPPRALPIAAVAILQIATGLRRRHAGRCLIGAGCLVASLVIAMPRIGAAGHQLPIVFHLVLIAVLAVGMAFDDPLGQFLRTTGGAMALLGSLAVITGKAGGLEAISWWQCELYPVVMCLLIAGYGLMLGHRASAASAALILSAWMAAACCRGYSSLRLVVAGIDYIAVGMVLFSVAVLTSMAKGGVLPRRITRRPAKLPDAPG